MLDAGRGLAIFDVMGEGDNYMLFNEPKVVYLDRERTFNHAIEVPAHQHWKNEIEDAVRQVSWVKVA